MKGYIVALSSDVDAADRPEVFAVHGEADCPAAGQPGASPAEGQGSCRRSGSGVSSARDRLMLAVVAVVLGLACGVAAGGTRNTWAQRDSAVRLQYSCFSSCKRCFAVPLLAA